MPVTTELAASRTAALDLLNHIQLRCGGRPDGSLVVVSYPGEEDVAGKHPLAVVSLNPTSGGTPSGEALKHVLDVVREAGADRIAMVAFDEDMPLMVSLTGAFVLAIGLPVQRLLVDREVWLDPDHPSVTGRVDDLPAAAVTAEIAADFLGQGAAAR